MEENMKKVFCYFVSCCILIGVFSSSALAGFRIYSKRLSPTQIKVKIMDPRPGSVNCSISTHDGTPLGQDGWYHHAPMSTMIINVPGHIIDPNPEVNCTINYN